MIRAVAPAVLILLLPVCGALPHPPISIGSDLDWMLPGSGVVGGTGTAEDPFIIADWEITDVEGDAQYGVVIDGTQMHYVLRSLTFEDSFDLPGVLRAGNAVVERMDVTDWTFEPASLTLRNATFSGPLRMEAEDAHLEDVAAGGGSSLVLEASNATMRRVLIGEAHGIVISATDLDLADVVLAQADVPGYHFSLTAATMNMVDTLLATSTSTSLNVESSEAIWDNVTVIAGWPSIDVDALALNDVWIEATSTEPLDMSGRTLEWMGGGAAGRIEPELRFAESVRLSDLHAALPFFIVTGSLGVEDVTFECPVESWSLRALADDVVATNLAVCALSFEGSGEAVLRDVEARGGAYSIVFGYDSIRMEAVLVENEDGIRTRSSSLEAEGVRIANSKNGMGS